MSISDGYVNFLKKWIPGISQPIGRLTFKQKLKWTALILFIYFILSQISAFGVDHATLTRNNPFAQIQVLLGSKFGSLMTLGIGPIVTASIILQLLVGSKVIPWDLKTENGKIMFQGTQKLLAISMVFIEGALFVLSGAVPVVGSDVLPFATAMVILQFAMGGILVIFMDELVSKWGFGSGISLFIVAGVSSTIFLQMFSPFTQCYYDNTGSCLTLGLLSNEGDLNMALPSPTGGPVGRIPASIYALALSSPIGAFEAMLPVIATVIVFLIVIYINSIKVEIPLAFGSVRGFGRRWPLKFLYTSNIPVILVGALLANITIMSRAMADRGVSWLGTFEGGNPTGGLIYFLTVPSNIALSGMITFMGMFFLIGVFMARLVKVTTWKVGLPVSLLGIAAWYLTAGALGSTALTAIQAVDIARLFTYSMFMVVGAVVFSIFWTMTSGMDAHSVAEQIHSTGLQIPGFRRDIRIIERVLERYIPALTVLGGLAIGFLAAFADFTNALGTGTGILLSAMIVYQLYEEISTRHMEDMSPALRRFMSK